MKLWNKGKRAFIIDSKDAIAGCRVEKGSMGKRAAYIDGDTEVEVTDKCGIRLTKMYPVEIKIMEGASVASESKEKEEKTQREPNEKRDERSKELQNKSKEQLWKTIKQYRKEEIPENISKNSKKEILVETILNLEEK